MPSLDNPAGRLYDVLTRFKHGNFAEHLQMRIVYASVFDVAADDEQELLNVHSNLYRMADHIQEVVLMAGGGYEELYLRPVNKFRAALYETGLSTPWINLRGKLDNGLMLGLEYCSAMLSQVIREDVIEEAELKKLKIKVDKLVMDLMASGVNSPLKKTLVDYLEKIRSAIVQYLLVGSAGVTQAVEAGIVSVAREAEKADTEEEKGFLRRTTDVIKDINSWGTLGKMALEIIQTYTGPLQLTDQSKG